MGNYGARVSVDGQNVSSCDDLDTIMTSKYASFKGSLSGIGSTIVLDGATNTITIPHGLDHIPFAKSEVDVVYDSGYYAAIPVFGRFTVNEDYLCWGYCDTTNLYLKFNFNSTSGVLSHTFNYKYFIYVDKGKI